MSKATAAPVTRVAREALEKIETLPDLFDDELAEVEASAARNFTALSLHRKRPESRQGDRTARAWAFRQEWQDAAEALWLAVAAEQDRRRGW